MTMTSADDEFSQFFQAVAPPPADLEEVSSTVETFLSKHKAQSRPVVLLTSGGTTVPLEKNTVRFLDNFSSGTRGSTSAEHFLHLGYAVIFLHRKFSLLPFQRHFSRENPLDWMAVCSEGDRKLEVSLPREKEDKIFSVLSQYKKVKAENKLLMVSFETLFDYLFYLRAISRSLSTHLGRHGMIYLAAAVSDFYIHPDNMADHKIQSSGELQLVFHHTPKMVLPLRRHWAPTSFTVTFKLETEESLLVPHAKAALSKYDHQAVVANLLSTRRTMVTIVTKDSEHRLQLSEDEVARQVELEERLVCELADMHRAFMEQ